MTLLEIGPRGLDAILDGRIRTRHNPHGARAMESLGITPRSVRALLRSSHRGWLAAEEGEVVGFQRHLGREGRKFEGGDRLMRKRIG